MQHYSLIPHPDGPTPPTSAITVDVSRPKRDCIALRFVTTGEGVAHLQLPRPIDSRPGRHDELWQHTCFELFLHLGDGEAYTEYNFAPSGDWACYRFDSYREGMTAPKVSEPTIGSWLHLPRGADRQRGVDTDIAGVTRDFAAPFFELSAEIDLGFLTVEQPRAPWRVGLSAVIEDRKGARTYWALAHPPGAPDFHHPDCFALDLPAARPA